MSTRCHVFPLSEGGVKRDRAIYTGRLMERQASQREQGVGGERCNFRRYVYTASARDDCSGSEGPPVGRFKSQRFRQRPKHSLLCATSDSFARSEYSHFSGDTAYGAAVLHPVIRYTGLGLAVHSSINVSPATAHNSTLIVDARAAASATTTITVIPDISTGGRGASSSGFRGHRHRSYGAGSIHGSNNAVRCISNPYDGIPSAVLISAYEETATGVVGACEDSETDVG